AVRDVLSDEVVGIGVGAAGLVDVGRGVILFSPNFAWRDVPLAERLAARFGLPVTLDNDATAAAWGEAKLGAAAGARHALLITLGTGIGGGIVVDGAVMRGAHGLAGEIGHIVVEPDGPGCGCGNRGCWEQVASGQALEREGVAALERKPTSAIARLAGGDPSRVTGELVVSAAVDGDLEAISIVHGVARRLGEGIAGLVNVLDPEIVVVGGGLAAVGELLFGPAREAYRATVEGRSARPDVPIVPAALGNDAGAIGAALLVLEAAGG
ncbi:MAG TPA: ROK family protein, partial [Actinomycetota bacterium]|nr:ROK family protein [Actinomycetota bacterium]